MHKFILTLLVAAPFICFTPVASAGIIDTATVDYVGSETGTTGLSAKAFFELHTGGTQLDVTLTNNSVSPYGGGGVNGDAAMVLSGINWKLAPVTAMITGGSSALNGSSKVVKKSGSSWAEDASYLGDLNDEYGYSNTGVGNSSSTSAILDGVNAFQIDTFLMAAAVTAHSNGGNAVTTFNGGVGGVGGGLDFSLVATGSTAFGNNNFVENSVKFTLFLDTAVSNLDLSFLANGSYVEFGSDHAYVGGVIDDGTPSTGDVPEPASLAVWSVLGLVGFAGCRRRRLCGRKSS